MEQLKKELKEIEEVVETNLKNIDIENIIKKVKEKIKIEELLEGLKKCSPKEKEMLNIIASKMLELQEERKRNNYDSKKN